MESIGSLEEIVLMILLGNKKINSVDIAKEYEDALSKNISIPAIHVVLKRMEKKGWVKSEFGQPTAERGGRRKRIYWATPTAYKLVSDLNEAKVKLWKSVTKPSLNYAHA
ncbi:helix-turn-helix domain-containing protein [Ekhidna sp.]|uniref:PadR family transcriptional regulator n=1 Tax=Ekhidna sp. TaxID=2608089 RepID=UPI003297EE30